MDFIFVEVLVTNVLISNNIYWPVHKDVNWYEFKKSMHDNFGLEMLSVIPGNTNGEVYYKFKVVDNSKYIEFALKWL